jgi:hypothetical protein
MYQSAAPEHASAADPPRPAWLGCGRNGVNTKGKKPFTTQARKITAVLDALWSNRASVGSFCQKHGGWDQILCLRWFPKINTIIDRNVSFETIRSAGQAALNSGNNRVKVGEGRERLLLRRNPAVHRRQRDCCFACPHGFFHLRWYLLAPLRSRCRSICFMPSMVSQSGAHLIPIAHSPVAPLVVPSQNYATPAAHYINRDAALIGHCGGQRFSLYYGHHVLL